MMQSMTHPLFFVATFFVNGWLGLMILTLQLLAGFGQVRQLA